jgi:sporulation protein YlmC with PRC-barrel domain
VATEQTPDIDWKDHDVVDPDGEKVGSVEEVYIDAESGRPRWLLVKRGLMGLGTVFVPAEGAEDGDEGQVRIPYSKESVSDAPHYERGVEVDTEREAAIYRHYDLEPPARPEAEDENRDDAHEDDAEDEAEAAG